MDNTKDDSYYTKKMRTDLLFIVEHTNIPWYALYGLRNRIVHDYGNVVLDVVYDTLKHDIPEMLKLME